MPDKKAKKTDKGVKNKIRKPLKPIKPIKLKRSGIKTNNNYFKCKVMNTVFFNSIL